MCITFCDIMIGMRYALRKYSSDDYEFVYQTKKTAYKNYVEANYGQWDEKVQREYFDKFIDKSKYNIEIIVLDGKEVGFYQGENLPDGGYEIVNICIIPEYQNRGIGTQVLKDKIAEHISQDIRIQYFKQNPVGELYKRLGFEPDGETSTHFQMIRKAQDGLVK